MLKLDKLLKNPLFRHKLKISLIKLNTKKLTYKDGNHNLVKAIHV